MYYVQWVSFSEQALPSNNRDNNFSGFVDWLKSNNVDTSCVEIASFEHVGYGLKATKDMKVTSDFCEPLKHQF